MVSQQREKALSEAWNIVAVVCWLLAERLLVSAMRTIDGLIPDLPKKVQDWQKLRKAAFRQKYLKTTTTQRGQMKKTQ